MARISRLSFRLLWLYSKTKPNTWFVNCKWSLRSIAFDLFNLPDVVCWWLRKLKLEPKYMQKCFCINTWLKEFIFKKLVDDIRFRVKTSFLLKCSIIRRLYDAVLFRKTHPKQPPVDIYKFKANSTNTRKRCEICSKLTIKANGVVLVSLLLTLNIFHTLF